MGTLTLMGRLNAFQKKLSCRVVYLSVALDSSPAWALRKDPRDPSRTSSFPSSLAASAHIGRQVVSRL